MEIIKNIEVFTGNILIVQGEHGKLECLSLGDYGKEKNIKADFLGLNREINGVPHGDLLPLTKKWVVTISSQYGCSMNCIFCDVPKVGPGINATVNDMVNQVKTVLSLHPEVTHTERLNLHFARMGEPLFNMDNILDATTKMASIFSYMGFGFHPVVSTIMPKAMKKDLLYQQVWRWCDYKYMHHGEAGLQISINTTDENERKKQFNDNACSLERIAEIMKSMPLNGRKFTLNFALTDASIDAILLKKLFDPKKFLIKITPMHLTKSCQNNNIITQNGYTEYYCYKNIEEQLKNEGFDVIVFIPSKEEDESRITCGNAVLSLDKHQ